MWDDVPPSWSRVLLSEVIASLDAGVSVNSEGRQRRIDEIGVLKTSCVSGGRFNPIEHKAVLNGERGRVRVPVTSDAIILSRMNTPDLVGESAYVEVDQPDLFLPDRLWLLRTNNRANCRWLSFYMQSEFFRRQIDDIATGTSGSMKNISKGRLADLSLPLPPLDEQQRIGDVLKTVDAAISSAKAVARAARRTTQTMRHELLRVSADGEIGDLPDGWDIRPLETLASVERGKFSIRPRNDPRYFGGSTPFIQTGDITSAGDYLTGHTQTLNELGVTVSRVFPTGTIMTTIAANIGDFAITTYPVACPDSVVGIEAADGVHPFWLYSVLSCFKVALDRASTQNAQKNINLQTLRPLLIPVPPSGLMVEMAETLEVAADMAREAEDGCRTLVALKGPIMDDLLSGRVRVPV